MAASDDILGGETTTSLNKSEPTTPLDTGPLKATFVVDGKEHIVELYPTHLDCFPAGGRQAKAKTIPIEDIISCHLRPGAKQNEAEVRLHHVVRHPKGTWRHVNACLRQNAVLCQQWAGAIQAELDKIECRPRNMLVFVNPVGGRKKGEQIYQKLVDPLFHDASIIREVIVTTHATHASEVLEKYDVDSIDSVVVVGGDGTFTQVMTSLLRRTARDAGVDVDRPQNKLVKPKIRMGIIPSGTGQGMIKIATGTYDVVTGALQIITGHTIPVDVLSAHNGGRLLSYGSMLACCGFFGDMIKKSESSRGLGMARYPMAMLKTTVKHRDVSARARFLPFECEDEEDEAAWKEVQGPFKGMNLFLLRMENTLLHPTGYAGFLDMCLIKPVGRFRHLNAIRKVMFGTGSDVFENDYIERQQVRVVRWEFEGEEKAAAPGAGGDFMKDECLNVDGDPFELTDSTIEIRYHAGPIQLFGCGFSGASSSSSLKQDSSTHIQSESASAASEASAASAADSTASGVSKASGVSDASAASNASAASTASNASAVSGASKKSEASSPKTLGAANASRESKISGASEH